MNIHAMPREEVARYAGLFREYLAGQGVVTDVEIGRYQAIPGASILYGAQCEDDWYYDDFALVTPQAPDAVDRHGRTFIESLGEPSLTCHLAEHKLVVLRKKAPRW